MLGLDALVDIPSMIEGYLKQGLENGAKKYKIAIEDIIIIIYPIEYDFKPKYVYYKNEEGKILKVEDVNFKRDILEIKYVDLTYKEAITEQYMAASLKKICFEHNVDIQDISIMIKASEISYKKDKNGEVKKDKEGNSEKEIVTACAIPYNDGQAIKNTEGHDIHLPMEYFLLAKQEEEQQQTIT